MKKSKNLCMNIICSSIILLAGVLLLIFPSISQKLKSANTVFYVVMYLYTMVKLVEYFSTKEKQDYENLFVAIASLIIGSTGLIFNLIDSPIILSFTLVGWVGMVSIIRLIKVDYLMDNKNKMWQVKMASFLVFILIGTITCFNLYYESETQTLMLGSLIFIDALLEMGYSLILAFCSSATTEEINNLKFKNVKPQLIGKTSKKPIRKASVKVTTKKPIKKPTSKKRIVR